MMSRRWAVGCVLALVSLAIVSGAAVVVGAAASGAGESAVASTAQADSQPEFERAQFRLRVTGDGNATWTFAYYRTLDGSEEREEFESFAERFRTESTPLFEGFEQQADALAGAGANYTGREMTATDFSRDAYVDRTPFSEDATVDQPFGDEIAVVEMSFTWTNFARVDGDRLYVGDVFDQGLYLAESQSLVLEVEEGLTFESVGPDGATASGPTLEESRSVTWSGELDFPDGHPRAVIATESGGSATEDSSSNGSDGEATDPPSTDDGTSLLGSHWIALGGLVLLVAAVSAAAIARRNGGFQPDSGDAAAAEPNAPPPEPDAERQNLPEESLEEAALDDDELVVRLLERNGGRMHQSEIVSETPWSKSKVSMLLSEMEEEDVVSKIQVGRENIVALQGNEPDAVGTSLDELDDR